MSRERTIYDSQGELARFIDDELMWIRPGADTGSCGERAPMVIRDIEPYKSMITGEMIDSRSVHRDHLRRHHCVEIGNDMSHVKQKRAENKFPSRKKVLASQLADLSDRQIKKIVQNEIKLRRQ
jgi:hypothetical protein